MAHYTFKKIDEDRFEMRVIDTDGKTYGPYIKTREQTLGWIDYANSEGCTTEIEF